MLRWIPTRNYVFLEAFDEGDIREGISADVGKEWGFFCVRETAEFIHEDQEILLKGDIVLAPIHAGMASQLNGRAYRLVPQTAILAIGKR